MNLRDMITRKQTEKSTGSVVVIQIAGGRSELKPEPQHRHEPIWLTDTKQLLIADEHGKEWTLYTKGLPELAIIAGPFGLAKCNPASTPTKTNKVLKVRELCFVVDENVLYIGDGVTPGGICAGQPDPGWVKSTSFTISGGPLAGS